MPTPVTYTNSYLSVNANDLSTYITQVAANFGSEALDKTTMGQTFRVSHGGLKTAGVDGTFLYEQSTSSPEAVLWSLIGTTSCVEYRHINACSSSNNPIYSGVMTLTQFNVGAAVGALLPATFTFVPSGTISRASSS